MTQNQIAYWNMVYDNRHKERADSETARSNYAKESETQRTNMRNEAIKAGDVFGNLELNQNKLYETQRHNIAQEQIQSSGTLQQWVSMGLNPLWYTNGLPAAATAAMGYWTLPTQQDVTSGNINTIIGDIKQISQSNAARAQAVKDTAQRAKQKITSAAQSVMATGKSVATNVFQSAAKGINQRARSTY